MEIDIQAVVCQALPTDNLRQVIETACNGTIVICNMTYSKSGGAIVMQLSHVCSNRYSQALYNDRSVSPSRNNNTLSLGIADDMHFSQDRQQ